jgi:pimeloyl-ACP methyl ester carboxylesterase
MRKYTEPGLIQVVTEDGLYLHGYFSPNKSNKTALLHIHGFEGNFYENSFVHALNEEMSNNNIAFLTVNTRGNGKDTDFNTKSGSITRIGAHYELLEQAHLDISAWLDFLFEQGYTEVILQGHSLGTMKAVRYLSEGKYKDRINKLILLSPFDKKGLLKVSGKPPVEDLLNKATNMIKEGKGEELVTREFEDIPMSYQTFSSWYKQDELGRVFEFCSPEYDFPALKNLSLPTKVIVGSKDEYFYVVNPEHPEEAMDLMLKHLPHGEGKIISGSVHSFSPHEDIMAKEVVNFIKKEK